MTAVPKALRATWLDGAGVRLDWRVDHLDAVMETWESVQVYSRAVDTDPWAPLGAPVPLVTDTHEYAATDGAGVETTLYTVAFYESVGPTEGDKVAQVYGSGGGRYITVQDLRVAGWSVTTDPTNDELRRAITYAESYVERVTGNVFYPYQREYTFDGVVSERLLLNIPIVQIDEIVLLGDVGASYTELVEWSVEGARVYNRHITQGLTNPDDRDSPKIQLLYGGWQWGTDPLSVKLNGWWGYTEPGPGEVPAETEPGSQVPVCRGGPPLLLKRALELLMPRFLASPADPDAYEDAIRWHQVTKYEARDQKIEYSKQAGAAGGGGLTGDPEVDRFLMHFIEPPVDGEMV
jgi:hypothetical protein